MHSPERGQAVPLVVLLAFLVLMAITAVLWLGMQASLRAKAQAAADAVSLAGVGSGRRAAEQIANENKATIVRYEIVGEDVRVRVKVKSLTATARARAESVGVKSNRPSALRAAMARAEQIAHHELTGVRILGETLEVDEATAKWLGPLSGQSGLCQIGVTPAFRICGT